jgi:hypothetical protein
MKDYLVVFSSHSDTDQKKKIIEERLKKLKEGGVDVCLSTHCKDFLGEFSPYVKYLIYDENNEFINLNDYLENSRFINYGRILGQNFGRFFHPGFEVETKFPSAFHSKSALTILRNGSIISKINNYKWTVYIESDLEEPLSGYKSLIDDKIRNLEEEGKKCFYFINKYGSFDLMWGKFLIFKTFDFLEDSLFFQENWHESKVNFMKHWGLNFAESITLDSFHRVYGKDFITEEDLNESHKKYWSSNPGLTNEFDSFKNDKISNHLNRNFIFCLLPEINSSTKKIHSYMYNRNSVKVSVDALIISSGSDILYNLENLEILPDHWRIFEIKTEKNLDGKKIEVYSKITIEGKKFENNFSLEYDELENMHNYIMKIIFK